MNRTIAAMLSATGKLLNEGYDVRLRQPVSCKRWRRDRLSATETIRESLRQSSSCGPLFGYELNDTTNAFKAYRRSVIDGCRPLISPHFNLTVELPLKAIARGYSAGYSIPITWRNRRNGQSKLRMKEMGSRYLFICFYVLLEKWLSRGDYRKNVTFTV